MRPLDDYELATRLSYFLWSSLPDRELFLAAQQGRLQDPQVLEQQVRRMLHDRRITDGLAGGLPLSMAAAGSAGPERAGRGQVCRSISRTTWPS